MMLGLEKMLGLEMSRTRQCHAAAASCSCIVRLHFDFLTFTDLNVSF